MFGQQREVILNESNWEPHDTQLAYIEAWSYPRTDVLTSYNYRQGSLQDAEVKDWLYQKGQFAQPNNAQPRNVDGGIRLLICERVGWQPLGFAMSKTITLKVPQMYQLGNYGLALFHSFKTGITVAFLHGWNVLAEVNQVTGVRMISHAGRTQELIQSTISLWTHPLLIPVILLEEHIFRASDFCEWELSRKTVDIEMRLGVTHSGPLTGG